MGTSVHHNRAHALYRAAFGEAPQAVRWLSSVALRMQGGQYSLMYDDGHVRLSDGEFRAEANHVGILWRWAGAHCAGEDGCQVHMHEYMQRVYAETLEQLGGAA